MHTRQVGRSKHAAVVRALAGAFVCFVAFTQPLAPIGAHAAVTAEQGRCKNAAAAAGLGYFKSTAAAIARCKDAISAAKLGPATDCRSESDVASKIAKAVSKLDAKLAKSCTAPLIASLRFGRSCTGVTDVAGLAACLENDHDADADRLLKTVYGPGGEISDAAARKCQATASKQARAEAAVRAKALRSCRNNANKEKLPIPTVCATEAKTAAKLAKKRAAIEGKLGSACDAGAIAALTFGSPCSQAADGAVLAACLLDGADVRGDDVSLAAYGDGSFCADSHQAVNGRIEEILAQMTLQDKVDQMHGNGLHNDVDGIWWSTADDVDLGIPGFHMLDGPRGVSQLSGNATAFPVGIARGATWDVELEERVGSAIGEELRAKGGSVLLAPVTAVIRHPRWGRSQESYGEDPLHLGLMGVAFVRGVQQHALASVKHFAMNSIEDTRYTVSVNIDERSMREIYLPHFRRVVEEGNVASVMTAYNRINGTYAAENFHLVREILKGDWDFQGFVESDWVFGTRSTVPSALAGLDIEMPFAIYYGAALVNAVGLGDVPEANIDDAVRRILRTKICFRLDTDPPALDPGAIETTEHVDLALETARESIVLLENDGGLLPLDRNAITTLAVVGPLADLENIGDTGSSNVAPTDVVTALEGIVDRAGSVSVVHVTDPSSPAGQSDIAGADAVVVVVGFTSDDEGETTVGAGDRDSYELSAEQEQLITDVAALNAATIVVLEGGSAIGVENWVDDVEALMMAWYPGQQGGNAIADILFGDVNPSGKLPLVVAASEADLPPFINDQDDVTYEYYHGYRLLDHDGNDPRYPFGYGLSYTTFSYSNLVLEQASLEEGDTLRVAFDVTNTGSVAGDEVAQLYVGYVGSAVDRPVLDLRGFSRVSLAPAETRTVEIEVPVEDLAYYDVGASAWTVEHITYGLHVGGSSRDLPLSTTFDVTP